MTPDDLGGTRALTSHQRLAAVLHARDDIAGYEPVVSRLVRLLAAAVEVPVVAASLITADRQVKVASCGSTEPPATGMEVPFTRSLCDRIVADGLPLIVDDVLADHRFKGKRTLEDEQIGAYAGFPVRADDGQVIGVLDMADQHQRHWTSRELAAADLAAQLFADLLVSAAAAGARADVAAGQQQATVDALLDSLDTGVITCDARGEVVRFNGSMHRFLGVAAPGGAMSGQWPAGYQVTDPDGHPITTADMPLSRALAGEPVHNFDLVILDDRSTARIYRTNARPIDDPAGTRLGAVTTMTDLTDERRAERFRRCEIAVTQATIRATDITQVGHATLVALAETLGWPYAELWVYDHPSHTMRPAGHWKRSGFEPARPIPQQLQAGAGLPGQAWARHHPVWIDDVHAHGIMSPDLDTRSPLRSAVVVPLRLGTEVYGALSLFATETEHPSDALNRMLSGIASRLAQYMQLQDAEALSRHLLAVKDNYLDLLSHEIRTPLTSITAFVDLLGGYPDDQLPSGVRDLLTAIARNSDSMRRVVDRLLQLAAVEDSDTELIFTQCDFPSLVHEAVTAAAQTARDWGVTITVDAPDTQIINCDHEHLHHVLDEVLSNAIIYSHPGGNVSVTLTHDTTDNAVLTVTDTGIGIPTDELERVFQRFQRSSRVRELGIPGTGLGLAFSRIVLDRHHGSITVQPVAPGGITATIRLPTHQPTPLSGAPGPTPHL